MGPSSVSNATGASADQAGFTRLQPLILQIFDRFYDTPTYRDEGEVSAIGFAACMGEYVVRINRAEVP